MSKGERTLLIVLLSLIVLVWCASVILLRGA